MTGPELTLLNWLLASAPVVLLVVTILALDWSAPRAGAAAWVVALGLGLLAFGAARDHVAIASAKGLSLALFVLTIVWASVYMFNLVDRLRGIDAIGRAMARLADDRLTQALLIGWGFSSFIQGITGFGVPVAVAAPLLIMLGFSPARAAGMALVGHGWAVTFGSMGSSYYTIQLVTGIEGDVIAPHMALLFAPVILVSGALVAHIHGGLAAVVRSLPLVVVAGGGHGGGDVRPRPRRRAADRLERARRPRHGRDRPRGPHAAVPAGARSRRGARGAGGRRGRGRGCRSGWRSCRTCC